MTTDIHQFKWQPCIDFLEMKELYEYVIPKVDLWNPTILTKYPNIIKGLHCS